MINRRHKVDRDGVNAVTMNVTELTVFDLDAGDLDTVLDNDNLYTLHIESVRFCATM